jgi:hypothetical protein
MTTKLIPPNITPNWRPSQGRVGLLKVEHEEGDRKYFSLQNWYVQDDDQHASNCRFFGATAAMAEALAIQLERMEWACENVFSEEAALWMQKSINDMGAVLLSAGYTLAADPE